MKNTEIQNNKLQDQALWDRLVNLSFNDPNTKITFAQRLANELGWSKIFANSAIHEYRKFLYLAMVASPVTPSLIVDEVWHLHLKNEDHYRVELCEKVLLKPLEHIPSDGSETDIEKHRQQYVKTLDVYEVNFGVPPIDIWGASKQAENKTNFSRYIYSLLALALFNFYLNSRFLFVLILIAAFILFVVFIIQEGTVKKQRKSDGSCTTYLGSGCGGGGGSCGGGCGGGD